MKENGTLTHRSRSIYSMISCKLYTALVCVEAPNKKDCVFQEKFAKSRKQKPTARNVKRTFHIYIYNPHIRLLL